MATKTLTYPKTTAGTTAGMPYAGMGTIDRTLLNSLGSFMASSGEGTVHLPDLSKSLTARYNPYNFTMPEYQKGDYQETIYSTPDMTAADDIESVADLPPGVMQAIFEQSRSRVGRAADTQRRQAQNQFGTMGAGGRNLLLAAIRDINRNQFEQEGDLTTQSMIQDAQRNYEEAKNLRGLRLGREETLANMLLQREGAQAGENQAGYRFGVEENRFQTGLADTLQTRQAAEQEKKYQADYGRQQDVVNTQMNQAQFQSAERANEASRQQAAIQQALNYMNQGGNYRLNTAQLQQKGEKDDTPLDWGTVAGGVGQAAGSLGGYYANAGTKPLVKTQTQGSYY